MDDRLAAYAQLLVAGEPQARPLIEEVSRFVARRGASVTLRVYFPNLPWAEEAPEELLAELPPLQRALEEGVEAKLLIGAPENTRGRRAG